MNRTVVTVGLVVVVALGLAVGGVAASEETEELDVEVSEDGEFESFDWSVALFDEEYEDLAAEYGEDEVASGWAAAIVDDGLAADAGSTEDEQTDDGWFLHVEFTEPDSSLIPALELEAEGDEVTLTYSDDGGEVAFTFSAEMPGSIVESNADDETDTTASWYVDADEPADFTVTADIGADDPADDDELEDDDASDADDDGMPGPGVAVAVLGVLAATSLLVRRQ